MHAHSRIVCAARGQAKTSHDAHFGSLSGSLARSLTRSPSLPPSPSLTPFLSVSGRKPERGRGGWKRRSARLKMRSASGLCSQLAASFLCIFLPACVGKHPCRCGRSTLCIEISMEKSCGVLVYSILCMSIACCDFGYRWRKRCYAAEPTLPRCVEMCWSPCCVLDVQHLLSTLAQLHYCVGVFLC